MHLPEKSNLPKKLVGPNNFFSFLPSVLFFIFSTLFFNIIIIKFPWPQTPAKFHKAREKKKRKKEKRTLSFMLTWQNGDLSSRHLSTTDLRHMGREMGRGIRQFCWLGLTLVKATSGQILFVANPMIRSIRAVDHVVGNIWFDAFCKEKGGEKWWEKRGVGQDQREGLC